jgi:hypothetical protein
MTAEGNVQDTRIVAEAKQLIEENKDLNMSMPQALDLLKQQAKGDKEKMEKIKRTEKALGVRHSRHSGKKKKTKR